MGWFLRLKPHLTVNSKGELLSIRLTPGNTDDRKPIPEMCGGLFGMLFGDKGHLSKDLSKTLAEQGIALVTNQLQPFPFTEYRQS